MNTVSPDHEKCAGRDPSGGEGICLALVCKKALSSVKDWPGNVDCARAGRCSTSIGCRAHGKVREMLNDALQTVGGERRRR